VVGFDPVRHDARVTELGIAHHRLQAVDQRAVAAVVGAQRLLPVRGRHGVQIGDDVAAAERVDRLFGVADEDHGGVPAERAVDHLPLHRVGVLELVDHHDRPPVLHPHPRRRVLRLQRLGQPRQQVVVVQDAEPAFTRLQLCTHRPGELHADKGIGAGRGIGGP
jgi:hypothetical protein